MKTFWVWVGTRLYKLVSDGHTLRYEGNGRFVVKGTKVPLNNNQ